MVMLLWRMFIIVCQIIFGKMFFMYFINYIMHYNYDFAHDNELILKQPIWNNSLITINKNPVCYRHWFDKGVRIINDLLLENGNFVTYDQFVSTFSIRTIFFRILWYCTLY